LGTSRDDAAGEAFDKTAKLLGLPYPGGPQLAQLARRGTPGRLQLPRPMLDRAGLEFSFSGLKDRGAARGARPLADRTQRRTSRAACRGDRRDAHRQALRALEYTGLTVLVVSGGVSANRSLPRALTAAAGSHGARVYYPRIEFCSRQRGDDCGGRVGRVFRR